MGSKLFALLCAVGIGFVGFQGFRFLAAGPGLATEKVVFEVPPGKSFRQLANQLREKKLISNILYMRILAKLTGQGGRVKMGEYALDRGMTPQEILTALTSGKSIQYPITFPEGANIYEMGAALEAKHYYKAAEFLKLCHDKVFIREMLGTEVSSLEGYLFPETYNVTKYTPLRELIANMVQNFKAAYDEAENQARTTPGGGAAGAERPALSKHELVILASMVEKETGAPEERPLIASVFYNRLRKNMKLQSDPTIIYGFWDETGAYKANITKEDITKPNRYNTYTEPRLPFGPISNPGSESLRAVMKPATSEFLFFVSHNDGTHAFTKTYDEHTQAVKTFQLNPAAREGKSWRDLKKRTAGAPRAGAG